MTAGRERHLVQRLLVVAQVAVSLVLLAGALLFIRSFRNLTTFDAGIRQENVFVGFFGFNRAGLPEEQWLKHKRLLAQEVAAVPGVVGAATATNLPLLGGDWEHRTNAGEKAASAKFTWVGPGYFDVTGIPILQGRAFQITDTAESPRVAVVNEAFVEAFLADRRPIGETLRTDAEPGFPETVYEIVGVIPNTRYDDLRSGTPPMVFAPDEQVPNSGGPFAQMLIQVSGPATMEAVRRTFAQTRVREGLVRERMLALLSGFFGLLAAVLTMAGLYGVISYLAVRRRNEIGIRMALGALRPQIVRMVLRDALRLLAVGIAAGAAVSLIVGRSAGALLFELEPSDPMTLGVSALLLGVTAVLASLLPAWRAAKRDPVSALRQD
jgi:predicted permease